MKIRVFVTLPFESKEGLEILHSSNFDIVINQELPLSREKLLREVRGCHGLICFPCDQIDKELIDFAGDQLKVICSNSVGFDHIDLKECYKKKIKVGYVPDIISNVVAEFTIGLLINVARRISEGIELAKHNDIKSLWNSSFLLGKSLEGSTVGIVGLGRIGMSIAKRLKGFDLKKLIYHNRKPNEDVKRYNLPYEYVGFDELLSQSDFVICACSLNKESEKLFNKKAFEKMKSDSIFINISRGRVVEQDDLFDALKENAILAAGLDVTTPQPLPKNHKLFSLANCFITPYIASLEENCCNKMDIISARNLINGLNEKPLLFEIVWSNNS